LRPILIASLVLHPILILLLLAILLFVLIPDLIRSCIELY
jgi:hypothetical protein